MERNGGELKEKFTQFRAKSPLKSKSKSESETRRRILMKKRKRNSTKLQGKNKTRHKKPAHSRTSSSYHLRFPF